MKRQISILACLLMLLAVVFAVASCSQPEAAHVHTYVESVTKEATCSDKGEVTLTCACGDKYTNETAAKGHNLVTLEAVASTCVLAGKTEGQQCSDCGLVTIAQTTIAPKGHKLGAAATCTTAQTCEYGCGQVFVEALGHNAPAATCTEDSVCKRCGELQKPALGHDAPDATCTEDSVCTVCEDVVEEALGHTGESDCYTGWCTRCYEEMVYGNDNHEYEHPCDVMCSKCYEWVNGEAEHKLVHVEAKESTCTVNGNNEYWYCEYCSTCWNSENTNSIPTNIPSETLPLAEHEYFYACDPVCMNCYELTNEEAAHSIIHVEAKAPTCTVYGNIEYWYCEYCGTACDNADLVGRPLNMMSVRVPETGHAYFYACDPVCMNCYELTNEEAAHSIKHVEAKAPTCTEIGNVEYWYCEHCGSAWSNAELTFITNMMSVNLPATGHNYAVACDPVCLVCYDINTEAAHDIVHEEAKAPNCTENGNIENWYCSYCNLCWIDEDLTVNTNRNSVVIPNLGGHKGHDYDRKCDVCSLYVLPEAGEAFKLGMYQTNLSKKLYITGVLDGFYGVTVENKYATPDFFIENATDGFYIYFMSGTTKTYISVEGTVSGGKNYNNVKFSATKGLFTFDQTTGAFFTTTTHGTVYLGTYNDFDTLSASYISYITGSNASKVDKTQFILRPEVLVPHDCDGSAPSCTQAGSACSICGIGAAALGHSTPNAAGKCGVCGETIVNYTTVSVSIGTYASANGWKDATSYTSIKMDGKISVSVTNSNSSAAPKYYTNGNNLRCYTSSNSQTVVKITANNATIASVKITYTVSNDGQLYYGSTNISSGTVVNINASSAEFIIKDGNGASSWGQVRITAIEVVYE